MEFNLALRIQLLDLLLCDFRSQRRRDRWSIQIQQACECLPPPVNSLCFTNTIEVTRWYPPNVQTLPIQSLLSQAFLSSHSGRTLTPMAWIVSPVSLSLSLPLTSAFPAGFGHVQVSPVQNHPSPSLMPSSASCRTDFYCVIPQLQKATLNPLPPPLKSHSFLNFSQFSFDT